MKWFTLLLLLISMPAFSQNSIDIVADRDNTLYEDDQGIIGDFSNGAGEHLFVGRTRLSGLSRRAILHFNLEAIPQSATIDSVHLILYMDRAVRSNQHTVTVHEILNDWGEAGSIATEDGGGKGAEAKKTDATWTQNFFDLSTWETPGGDFDSLSILSSQEIDQAGEYTWIGSFKFTNLANRWLNGSAENYGILLKSDETDETVSAKRYRSRESDTNKPRLRVFYTAVGVSNDEETDIPTTAVLEQNYPNPFNPSTNITFALPVASQVQLNVYDIVGRRVATVFDGFRAAGSHTFNFDASQLSSGIYIYTLEGANFLLSRKLTLIK